MSARIRRAPEWLHERRAIFIPLLSVVAAASLAFSVEVLIIDGLSAVGGVLWLLLAGAAASVLLAVITAFDVRAAVRYGVVLHVALLRERSWRRRHEVEHELLVAQARERSSLATTTALSAAETEAGADAAAHVADMMLDSAATGAALLPGARDLRILAAGDIPSLISLAYTVQPALAGWRTSLLVDRSHEAGEPFTALRLPEAGAGGTEDATLVVLVGDRLDPEPAERYAAASPEPVRIVRRGDLPEERGAYEAVLSEIAGGLSTRGRASIGVGGPAVLGFAAGWLAAGAGARELRALDYADHAYRPGRRTAPASLGPVAATPSLGIGPRLLLVSFLLAATSTLAFGSFATLLEWWLAGSNACGPATDWVWLIAAGIAVPAALARLVLYPWSRRLARPDVRVLLRPRNEAETGTRRELLVAPRSPQEGAAGCVGWLLEAMADIRSFRPGSRIVIDLDTAPPALPLEPLGSYLNRGHRGSEVRLRCGGHDYPLTGDHGPEPVRRVRTGYRDSLRYARDWEAVQ